MPTSQQSIGVASSGTLGASRIDRLLISTVILALGLSTLMRVFVGADQPLWLDEVWTGSIVSIGPLPSFIKAIYVDATPPLYSCILYCWQTIAGLSNEALRLPGVCFGIAAPLILLRSRVPALLKEEQLTWSALLALWIPGLWFSQDARTYTLLLLISAAQTIAFARLMATPGSRLACCWCGLAVLAIFTHDHSLVLSGLQGLAYLCWHPRAAVKSWRAGLILLIPGPWLAVHLPNVLKYLPSDVAWFPLLHLRDLPYTVSYILGDFVLLLIVPFVFVGLFVLGWRSTGKINIWQGTSALWITVGTAAGSALFVCILGAFRPTFTFRYLTPFVPGLMLGLSLLLRVGAQRSEIARPAMILLFLTTAIGWARSEMIPGGWARGETRETERIYNFEIASDMLMHARPDRLVFLTDSPTARATAPEHLAAMGGFFFHRQGQPVTVEPVMLQPGEDANSRLLQRAEGSNSAILWLFDKAIHGTSAAAFPPRLGELDPRWLCRDFGRDQIGIVACVQRERV